MKEQLMIGNIVKPLEVQMHNAQHDWAVITSLTEDIAHWKASPSSIGGGEVHSGSYYNDLSGIPLTPEILEKCGFKWETSQKKHLCWNEPNKNNITFSFTIEQIEEGEMNCYCENSFQAIWEVKIKYLHQLQNLVNALTSTALNVQL